MGGLKNDVHVYTASMPESSNQALKAVGEVDCTPAEAAEFIYGLDNRVILDPMFDDDSREIIEVFSEAEETRAAVFAGVWKMPTFLIANRVFVWFEAGFRRRRMAPLFSFWFRLTATTIHPRTIPQAPSGQPSWLPAGFCGRWVATASGQS